MSFIMPQINNIQAVPVAKGLDGMGATPSGSGGSFMSVLASMMNDGGGGLKSFMSELGNNGNPLDAMLQKLENYEGLIDPLMMSFIQQLLANPQQFQDAFKGNIVASDNNIHLIAQLNNGQFKDLTEFVKGLISKQDLNSPLTDIRQVLIDRLNKNLHDNPSFTKTINAITTETKETVVSDVVNDSVDLDIIKTSTQYIQTPEGIKEGLIAQPEKDITDSKAQNNLAEHLMVKADKHTDNNSLIDKKGLKVEVDKKITTHQEANSNLSGNVIDEELATLLKNEDITIEEVSLGQTTKANSDASSSVKTESPQISATNNVQQGTHTKTDNTTKETLHISRLQEIDARVFKAIETGQKSLTVRLEPPELGSVHIKLVLADGMVRADMKVDSSAVKDMMNLALPQIKNSLENAGIKVSEFFVDIREEYYSDGRQNQRDNDSAKDQRQQKKQKDEGTKPFEFYI